MCLLLLQEIRSNGTKSPTTTTKTLPLSHTYCTYDIVDLERVTLNNIHASFFTTFLLYRIRLHPEPAGVRPSGLPPPVLRVRLRMRGLLAGAGGRRRGGGRAEGEGGRQRGEAGEARQDVKEEGKEGGGGERSLDEVGVAVAAVVMLENNFESFLEDYRKVCITFPGKRRVRKRGGGRR